jgi:hypothetical protein
MAALWRLRRGRRSIILTGVEKLPQNYALRKAGQRCENRIDTKVKMRGGQNEVKLFVLKKSCNKKNRAPTE